MKPASTTYPGETHRRIFSAIIFCALALALAPFTVFQAQPWAQGAGDTTLFSGLEAERAAIEKRFAGYGEAETRAKGAVRQSQSAYDLASRLGDEEAIPVAQDALRKAQATLGRIKRARSDDARRLEVLRKLMATREERNVGYATLTRGRAWRLDDRPLSEPLGPGDTVLTGPRGRVEIAFPDGQRVVVGGDSVFEMAGKADRDAGILGTLKSGRIMLFLRKAGQQGPRGEIHEAPEGRVYKLFRVLQAVAAVRGTLYEAIANEDGSAEFTVLQGEIEIEHPERETPVVLAAGQILTIFPDGSISGPVPLDPRSFQVWWKF